MTSESTIVANLIRSNNGLLGYDHFSPEGWATVESLIARGKVERRGGLLFAVATKAGKLTATTTEDAPVVTMDTTVSVRIGSDVYAGKVKRVTAATVTVQYGRSGSSELTFRPYAGGGWRAHADYVLVLGESETRLDPQF